MENTTLSYYVHSLDPFAIAFSETMGIRWYGLAYLGGFVCGYFIMSWMASKGKSILPKEKVADLITAVAIGTMLGGRVGYCLFYSTDLLTKFSGDFPYWGVLEVHKGGMASHGGLIGVIIACWIFARRNKVSVHHLIDLCTLGGSLGIFFGRLANFINGELYGREVPKGFKWAVQFPTEIHRWARNTPEKLKDLKDAVLSLGPGPEATGMTGELWNRWIEDYSWKSHRVDAYLDRLLSAVQVGNEKVIEALGHVLTPRYPSQIYQALLEGLLCFVFLVVVWRKPRKPGVIASLFGVLYGIMRIIGEQFRMPDAHIGYEWLGMTRGQWLSGFWIVFCLAYLVYSAKKKDQPKLGGWAA